MSQFNEKVQQWVTIDNQLKMIHEKTKEMRYKKNELLNEIIEHYKNNNNKNSIDISDGSLKIYEKKEYNGLTYSYIEECLGKIIQDKKHIEHIMNFLKENRQIKTTLDIRRIQSLK